MNSHQQTPKREELVYTITTASQSKSCIYKLLDLYYVPDTKEVVAITELKQDPISGSTPGPFYAWLVGRVEFKPGLLNPHTKINNIIVADQKELETERAKYKTALHFFSRDKVIPGADKADIVFGHNNDHNILYRKDALTIDEIRAERLQLSTSFSKLSFDVAPSSAKEEKAIPSFIEQAEKYTGLSRNTLFAVSAVACTVAVAGVAVAWRNRM